MDNIKQEILDKTSGGYTVFVKFFGKQCKRHSFFNIYRDDSRRSCTLYKRNNKYYMKDFGDSTWSGDCFYVVAMIQHLDLRTRFMDVLRIIDKELSLNIVFGDYQYTSLRKEGLPEQPGRSYSKIKDFKVTVKDFSPSELRYWGKYGITPETLKCFDVVSLSSCQFFREDGTDFVLYSDFRQPLYGYLFMDETHQAVIGVKTYRPGAKLRFLRAGTMPQPYSFGKDRLPDRGGDIFITGGEKDVLSLSSHGFSAICYNSETARIPSKDVVEFSNRFNRIILLYDMDETGRKESLQRLIDCSAVKVTSGTKVCQGILPLPGTKSMKDVSDYFSTGKGRDDFSKDLVIRTVTDYDAN